MAEYICREAIIDDLEKEIEAGNTTLDEDVWINKGLRIAIKDIKDIKIADVQPVKHGKWGHGWEHGKCTNCEKSLEDLFEGDFYYDCEELHFCPNCGARMDGDAEGRCEK